MTRLTRLLVLAIHLCAVSLIHAQATGYSSQVTQTPQSGGFIENWFRMTARTQAEQPHWLPPVVTAPARLLEVYRFDILRRRGNNGVSAENYGGGKGLELIVQRHIEILVVAPPPYIVHNNTAVKDGFGDWGFLVKYRIAAANEEHGNYILTAFFQTTFRTGQYKNGSPKTIITPKASVDLIFRGRLERPFRQVTKLKSAEPYFGTMLSSITSPRNSGRRSK